MFLLFSSNLCLFLATPISICWVVGGRNLAPISFGKSPQIQLPPNPNLALATIVMDQQYCTLAPRKRIRNETEQNCEGEEWSKTSKERNGAKLPRTGLKMGNMRVLVSGSRTSTMGLVVGVGGVVQRFQFWTCFEYSTYLCFVCSCLYFSKFTFSKTGTLSAPVSVCLSV